MQKRRDKRIKFPIRTKPAGYQISFANKPETKNEISQSPRSTKQRKTLYLPSNYDAQ